MKREWQTTEFWAVVVGAALWVIDKWTGTNILDVLSDGQALTDAKVQVAAIASSLREATGSDSNIIEDVCPGPLVQEPQDGTDHHCPKFGRLVFSFHGRLSE